MGDIKMTYGGWALVAGSAEGLGKAYSMTLAERGLNLIMVDDQAPQLHSLEELIREKFGTQTIGLHLDLADGDSVRFMMEQVARVDCRLMVYNAAFSKVKKFLDHEPADLDRYVDVNMRTPIRLIHAFAMHHSGTALKKGCILMSSLAGWWGTRLLGPYGASKAFNYILAEALYHELDTLNMDVLACIAGATATPAYLGTNPQYGRIRPNLLPPEKVVEGVLSALGRKPLYIPGLTNKLVFFLLSRILPRKMAAGMMNRTIGRMYSDRF